jgi:hypothetical protein
VNPLEALIDQLAQDHHRALALGDGRSVAVVALADRSVVVDLARGDWPSVQLATRYPLVVVEPSATTDDAAAVLHCAAQHVEPGGDVVVIGRASAVAGDRFDFHEVSRIEVEGDAIVRYRRTQRRTIHDLVFAARQRIARIEPQELADRSTPGRPPIGPASG